MKQTSLPSSRLEDCRSLDARSEESLSLSPSQVLISYIQECHLRGVCKVSKMVLEMIIFFVE